MDIWCNLNRGNTPNNSDIPLQFHLAKSRGCIHKSSILLGENCLFIVRIAERIDDLLGVCGNNAYMFSTDVNQTEQLIFIYSLRQYSVF